jgi:hypothetical protein
VFARRRIWFEATSPWRGADDAADQVPIWLLSRDRRSAIRDHDLPLNGGKAWLTIRKSPAAASRRNGTRFNIPPLRRAQQTRSECRGPDRPYPRFLHLRILLPRQALSLPRNCQWWRPFKKSDLAFNPCKKVGRWIPPSTRRSSRAVGAGDPVPRQRPQRRSLRSPELHRHPKPDYR